jgi:hypothetical protein
MLCGSVAIGSTRTHRRGRRIEELLHASTCLLTYLHARARTFAGFEHALVGDLWFDEREQTDAEI